jgi:flavodoxin
MKTLVVYDSLYGNTGKIAQAIGDALTGEVKVSRVGEVNPSELQAFDLLIVGSPTHGGRPSPAMREFLDKVQATALKSTSVAAFDTRHSSKLTVIFGYAAGRIAGSLKRKGGTLIVSPEGFLVTGTEGPLKEGELERAAGWAREIVETKKSW